ncbi:MAG: DNA repair protein RecO [Gammaproteobacteria bacterium]|nr:DNA repair protein RecO [Gammaproteobacteria bacterium]
MARVVLAPCFVLHGRPFRETSQILELLTRDHGRLGVVARGSRGGGKRGRPFQPFQPLLVSWSGAGELPTVTGVEAAGAPFIFRGPRIAGALYLNELILRLLHRSDPHPEIYAAYGEALERLAAPTGTEALFRVFEKRLLEALGYGLILTHEANSDTAIESDTDYHYRLDHGPVRTTGTTGTAALDEPKVTGRTLLALHREELTAAPELREAKRLMRFVVNAHLEGRPLETRQLFRSMG